MALTPQQQQIVQLAISKSRGASQRVQRSLLEALAVESSFRNLPYGDRDSQGVLQQRPSQGWGAPGNPAQDIGQYLTKAETLDRSGFQGTAGQLAQAVQRSAFPGRYDQHRGEAISLLNQFGGTSGGAPSPMGAAAPVQVGADPRRQIALALLDPKLRENPLALIQTIKGLRDQGSAGPPVANPMVGSQQTSAASGLAGGFLPGGARYVQGRGPAQGDHGRDLTTNPGGAIIAPGDGTVVKVGSDPSGFGPAYPVVHFTSGPYAGKTMYIGHTVTSLRPGQSFKAGQPISRTGTHGVGSATTPGWAEIGYGVPGTSSYGKGGAPFGGRR